MKFRLLFSCVAMLSGLVTTSLLLQLQPAEARSQGGRNIAGPIRPGVPVVRDHRPQPVLRDHRTNVRDHKVTGNGGGVKLGNGSVRKVDCLGNLC